MTDTSDFHVSLSGPLRRPSIRTIWFAAFSLWLGGVWCLGMASSAFAQSSQATAATAVSRSRVIVGINGHYRVGRNTTVRLDSEFANQLQEQSIRREQLRVETLDGDGVRVRYDTYPIEDSAIDLSTDLAYVVPGSEAAPLTIRKTDDQGGSQTLINTRFPTVGVPNRGPAMIPPSMPWMVSIGDPLGIDEIGLSNVLVDKVARIAVSQIDRGELLPTHWWGYDGVDLVLINAAGLSVLEQLSDAQAEALTRWVKNGGRVIVCLGQSAKTLADAAPWLVEWLPLEQVEVTRLDPAAFETFTSSQTPLEVFEGVRLPRREGRVLLTGRTTARVTAVLAAEYVVGFGRATVIAADLEQPQFAEWPERLTLITRIVGGLFDDPDRRGTAVESSTVFHDLAGQMRGVLDQFPIKPGFSFAVASLLLMLLIAAVGPLDYLLINRVLGRPLLGWLSFPLIAIALSIVLVMQSAPQVQNESEAEQDAVGASTLLRANQVQFVDLDVIGGAGRGFAWSYLYSHEPVELDVSYFPPAGLAELRDQENAPIDGIVYPMGYPGREFGGVQLADENTVLPPYEIHSRLADGDAPSGVRANVTGMTIASRSSKSIAAELSFKVDLQREVEVVRRPGSELLRGEFVNPLPVDLLDGMLIYTNRVYLLPTRVPAGGSVPSLSDVRQKNFRWRLTRKYSTEENSSETTPWSAGDFTNSKRVAEMLMFHRAAGGELYTGLRHDALNRLDLSEILVDDRCILIGRTEEPLFDLVVQDKSQPDSTPLRPQGQNLSMIRVVLPVRSTRL